MTYDPSDPDHVAVREEIQKTRREHQRAELGSILSEEVGRRFVWRLLTRTGQYETSFRENGLAMAFAEGERHIGLWILGEIMEVDPNLYAKMQIEAKARAEQELREEEEALNG